MIQWLAWRLPNGRSSLRHAFFPGHKTALCGTVKPDGDGESNVGARCTVCELRCRLAKAPKTDPRTVYSPKYTFEDWNRGKGK